MVGIERLIRRLILETSQRVGSVHFGGCFSVVEILVAYYWPVIQKQLTFPDFIDRNTLILSKGHCGLAVYSTLHALGVIDQADFESYCKPDGRFNGHIKRDDSLGIGWSTGSLGHGLSVGMGLSDGGHKRVTVILGDGELHEGQCWEAFMHLGMKTDDLNVIVDNNRMLSLGTTQSIKPVEPLEAKFDAFGLRSETIDGHDVKQIEAYFNRHGPWDKQCVLIANTVKGKGVSFMEKKSEWHTRAVNEDEFKQAVNEIGLR